MLNSIYRKVKRRKVKMIRVTFTFVIVVMSFLSLMVVGSESALTYRYRPLGGELKFVRQPDKVNKSKGFSGETRLGQVRLGQVRLGQVSKFRGKKKQFSLKTSLGGRGELATLPIPLKMKKGTPPLPKKLLLLSNIAIPLLPGTIFTTIKMKKNCFKTNLS